MNGMKAESRLTVSATTKHDERKGRRLTFEDDLRDKNREGMHQMTSSSIGMACDGGHSHRPCLQQKLRQFDLF